MKQVLAAAITLIMFFPLTAMAQHRPYAGMEARQVKALSAEQVADLKAGRGMGLALAAELNGYPGPAHVLELRNELSLSAQQGERVEKLFAAMKKETIPLGERLIVLESDLDGQFAARSITIASLQSGMNKIGTVQGELRAAHLKFHLLTVDILTPQQAARYAELRGYNQPAGPGHGHHQ